MTPTETGTRPRVEGERELEILEATLEVLDEVGYDLLTMDAVATRAKASKATLYRRWKGKPELVVAAIMAHKGDGRRPRHRHPARRPARRLLRQRRPQRPAWRSRSSPPSSPRWAATRSSPRSTAATSSRPKVATSRAIYERARERGEVHPDVDLSILAPSLAGIVLHRAFLLGEAVTPELVGRVLDEVILPAALHGPRSAPDHAPDPTVTTHSAPLVTFDPSPKELP